MSFFVGVYENLIKALIDDSKKNKYIDFTKFIFKIFFLFTFLIYRANERVSN